jgi:polyhydroxyalkanoate synthase
LKRAIDTGGGSLLRGLQNLLGDVTGNGAMPSQVDRSAFEVGRNLALTPGAVVYRDEVLELLQYAPTTERVHRRPLVLVPPQINKYYFLDLAPGKSFVEFAVASGIQTFVVSWRNPTAEHRDWGLETYLEALEKAIEAARAVTRSADVNVLGACAGAVTLMPLLAHLAARREARVHAVTLLVALLDTSVESPIGLFAAPEVVALARATSKAHGVLEGEALGRLFAWLRPNDLVWSYWVNNYLMGNDPPAFDVLYWNGDSTRLPARLHGDFLDIYRDNPFQEPGKLSVLGSPVDLSRVTADTYVVAGKTDHITPWHGCWSTTRMLGGATTFVLSSSGHIQSVINPPGNPKASYLLNPGGAASAEEWLAGATARPGSWWEHWRDWIVERSGPPAKAPSALGARRFPPREAAPGTYVVEA